MGTGPINTDLYQLLLDIYEFLDNYVDADWDGERYCPNRAMSLQQSVSWAMNELENL
jgi:hypothetical protein